jgi:hypothetical protein
MGRRAYRPGITQSPHRRAVGRLARSSPERLDGIPTTPMRPSVLEPWMCHRVQRPTSSCVRSAMTRRPPKPMKR